MFRFYYLYVTYIHTHTFYFTSLTPEQREQRMETPMTGSFVHLHLGIDATGLPADLESVVPHAIDCSLYQS